MALPRFATVRITLLLLCLLLAVFISAHQRVYSRNWNQTLQVSVFPINGDGYVSTERYIKALTDDTLAEINAWGKREARRHGLDLMTPFNVTLGPIIREHPPVLEPTANAFESLIWGLRFRYWAWKHTPDQDSLTRVRMFVVYMTGEENRPLRHSLGMQKGLLGLVYAYSLPRQTAQNNIVIAHELLHTVGAIDKYTATGSPIHPVGYANPSRIPLYPQRSAEVMAGEIPTAPHSSYMAESLRSVMINQYTAAEINWIEPY